MLKRRTIQFTRPVPPYQAGDIRTFEVGEADRYIKTGAATPYISPVDKQSDGPRDRRMGHLPVTKTLRVFNG